MVCAKFCVYNLLSFSDFLLASFLCFNVKDDSFSFNRSEVMINDMVLLSGFSDGICYLQAATIAVPPVRSVTRTARSCTAPASALVREGNRLDEK